MNNRENFLSDLFNEFEEEQTDLQYKFDKNLSRIKNIESTIDDLNRYDLDNNLFSPRVSSKNTDRINELLKVKSDLEEENKVISGQLSYLKNKSDSISEAVSKSSNSFSDVNKDNNRSDSINILVGNGDSDKSDAVSGEKVIDSKSDMKSDLSSSRSEDMYCFTKKEYSALLSSLESLAHNLNVNPAKAKMEVGSILYYLKHKKK